MFPQDGDIIASSIAYIPLLSFNPNLGQENFIISFSRTIWNLAPSLIVIFISSKKNPTCLCGTIASVLNLSVFSPFKTHHRQSYKWRRVLRFLRSFLINVAGAHPRLPVDHQLSQSIINKVHIAHTKDSFSIVDEQLNVNYYFNVWSAC